MKRKLKIKRFFIFIFLVVLVFLYLNFHYNFISFNLDTTFSTLTNNSSYDIIKQDVNINYLGIGQERLDNKDGYFTTFTTIETNKKIYKEYKQNINSSWNNNKYWGGIMAENGCGITAISIILSGYNKDYSPENLRQKYYPVLDSSKISDELSNTFNIKNSGFYYDSVHLSKNKLQEHLETNRPVLICVWNKPNNNRWTTDSHYMVLLACDSKDMVYISNPNGLENTSKSSGWYNFDKVIPYIAKALYIESY